MTFHRFSSPTRLASTIALFLAACDAGSGGAEDDTETQADAAIAADAESAAPPDAADPAACSDLEQQACVADQSCAPICAGFCDCECPAPSPSGDCGCEGCPPECFAYDGCEPVPAATTQCGDLTCDPDTEVCVVNQAFTQEFSCEEVPGDCAGDRDCDCLADDVCQGAFNLCSDSAEPNTVTCECPACFTGR